MERLNGWLDTFTWNLVLEWLIAKVKERVSTLADVDKKSFLGSRRDYLAYCLAIGEITLWVDSRNCRFFEAGAYFWCPHDFAGGAWYSSAVAVFIALYGKVLWLQYIWFDPSWTKNINLSLWFATQYGKNSFTKEESLTLEKKLPKICTGDYRLFSNAIKTTKSAIIISHQTLTDPGLRRDMPFWSLPGLHIDMCCLGEILLPSQQTDIETHTREWGIKYFDMPTETQILFSADANMTIFVYKK